MATKGVVGESEYFTCGIFVVGLCEGGGKSVRLHGLSSAFRASDATAPQHHGFNRAARGVRAVYRGFGVAVLGNVIGETSFMLVLEVVQSLERDTRTGAPSPMASMAGGMLGDFFAFVLTAPLCVACNRQITAGFGLGRDNVYRPLPQTLRDIWGLNQTAVTSPPPARLQYYLRGMQGLYAGAAATIAMMPAAGIWWATYNYLKVQAYTGAAPRLHEEAKSCASWWCRWFMSPTDNPLINAAAGVVASVTTATAFTPLMVVRTRLQTVHPSTFESAPLLGRSGANFAAKRFHAMYHSRISLISRAILRNEGPRGFFKGTSANISVSIIDGLVFSMVYELTKYGSDRGTGQR